MLLNKKPEITNGLIIEKIFLNIENSSKIKVIPLSERKEIKEKRKNRDFKKAIHKYFLELIEIIRELRTLNIQKKKYAQQDFVNELISQGITLGLSPTYLKEFMKELVKELQNKFDDFNLKGITTRWTYEDLQKLAQKKRGKLLSTREEFESIKTPPSHTIFLWECENGHKFKLSPAKIMQEIWCPQERKQKPWTYERLKELARERGLEKKSIPGKLLTAREQFEKLKKIKPPARTKYLWSCEIEGHEPWEARPDSIKDGSWCPICAPATPLTYEHLVKLARDRGIESTGKPGKFLTPKYKVNKISAKSKTLFLWQCGEGHEPWSATPSNIKLGRWCPICAEGTSERITRYFFESIFKAKFPKSSPKWLQELTGRKLHLDGYNEKLKLAFEFNGIQHYELIYGYEKLIIQRENDASKELACEKEEVILIIIPYDFVGRKDYVDYDKMQNFIVNEYEKKTDKKLPKLPFFDYRTRNFKRLDEF